MIDSTDEREFETIGEAACRLLRMLEKRTGRRTIAVVAANENVPACRLGGIKTADHSDAIDAEVAAPSLGGRVVRGGE